MQHRHLRVGRPHEALRRDAEDERHGAATTATRARRPTPARRAPAPAPTRSSCTASDQCHDAGTCNPATGVCSNPSEGDGATLQRRQRVHADRHLPERRLRRREPGRLHGASISATTPGTCNPATGVCSNPSEAQRHDAATTATRARRPTPARAARAPARTRSPAPALDQCHDAGHLRPGDRAVLESRPRPTARPATTATPARRPTRARAARARGAQPGRRARRSTSATTPAPATRRPGRAPIPTRPNGSTLQRRQRLHADRHLPERHLRAARNPRRPAPRSISATTPAPATRRRGACSNPSQGQRHDVQRRQRLHADRHLPERHVQRARNPVDLHGAGSVPRRRHLRPGDRAVLEPEQGRRLDAATTATRARRPTPARAARAAAPTRSPAPALDQCHVAGHVQSEHRAVLEPERDGRHELQRRQRVHALRYLPGRLVHRRQRAFDRPRVQERLGRCRRCRRSEGPEPVLRRIPVRRARVGTIYSWKWDDTEWSGNNTGDACALYDTDVPNDGKANLAICVTVSGKPAGHNEPARLHVRQHQGVQLHRCGLESERHEQLHARVRARPTRSPRRLPARRTSAAGPTASPRTPRRQCCVKTADLPSGSTLIDVCSYPSQSPELGSVRVREDGLLHEQRRLHRDRTVKAPAPAAASTSAA